MKVLLVGGGTAGHITPPLAVARKLKTKAPDIHIGYVIEKDSQFAHLVEESKDIDHIFRIRAGKFRRYHGRSWLSHVLDVPTNLRNIRDFFYFLVGCGQSLRFLRKARPDIVFIKGGFVGVPVGWACALLKIPFVTHDSDAVPGLANRLIGRWASLHLTGMPEELYSYPKDKTLYVGIPLSTDYHAVTPKQQAEYRANIGVPKDALMLTITGGSSGAVRLNDAVVACMTDLLQDHPDLYVFHQTGDNQTNIYAQFDANLKKHIIEKAFAKDLYQYTGAADVVIARAGATTIAELAVQQKACILVPNPVLTGGHQPKNAQHLHEKHAAKVVNEQDLVDKDVLKRETADLLESEQQRKVLQENIASLAKEDATGAIAEVILTSTQG